MVLVFEQLFDPDSCTFTYLIGDRSFGICALVDPVREQVDRDLERSDALGLRLIHTIETHIHAGNARPHPRVDVPVSSQRGSPSRGTKSPSC